MAKTIWTLDLEGAPTNEDCAQIGHTPNFDLVNTASTGSASVINDRLQAFIHKTNRRG